MVQLFSHRPATGTAYRADGQRIATAGEDGTVTLWDASLKRVELRFQAHERYKYCDVFSPDRTSLATLGDGMAKPWDVTKLDSLANVDVPAKHVPSEVSASTDRKYRPPLDCQANGMVDQRRFKSTAGRVNRIQNLSPAK